MPENFSQLFEGTTKPLEADIGSIIGVHVLEVRKDCVVVDSGLKSECFLPLSHFSDEQGQLQVSPGDEVDVVLDTYEDGNGTTKVSREKALLTECWAKIISAYNKDEIIQGYVSKRIRGGLQLTIGGMVQAFLPGSLVDLGFVRDNSFLENTTVDIKIIKIDPQKDNVVVSRRAALESIHGISYEKTIEKLRVGDVIDGIVKNFTDYGVFVNIGGVDGLLHITDVSWQRVSRPSEVLSPNQKIQVVILAIDKEKNRISLGYKQLQENPWLKLVEKFAIGEQLEGRVTSVTDFGCFVELTPGCEGLVHVSEMDWKNKNPNPNKLVKVDDMVKVQILDIDKKRFRVSLGMRQCVENPWEKFARTHEKGDRVKGIIRSTTDFGVFIELEYSINGLLNIHDLSWIKPAQESFSEFLETHKKGDDIEVIILDIQPQNQKITLGYKEEPDAPFKTFFAAHPKDSIIRAPVLKIGPTQTQVDLPGEVNGYLPSAELREESVKAIYPEISIGDEIEFQVDNLDKKVKMVRLHLKRLLEKETRKALRDIKVDKTSGGASFAEIATTRDGSDGAMKALDNITSEQPEPEATEKSKDTGASAKSPEAAKEPVKESKDDATATAQAEVAKDKEPAKESKDDAATATAQAEVAKDSEAHEAQTEADGDGKTHSS